MSLETVDIIIPSWNNPEYLFPAVQSILSTRLFYPLRIIVVNNGHPDSVSPLKGADRIEVAQCDRNLGWEGGLKEGLKRSNSKFVAFVNDDVFIPRSSANWLRIMMSHFSNPEIGAVGPISNCVMGPQNMLSGIPGQSYFVNYLIGFCVLLRREALDRAGGVDDTLPGGDDIDLSIRLRDAGYKLVMARTSFVYHHGFKTGERIHGGPHQGGWNSMQMTEATNHALIVKHGLRKWFDALYGQVEIPDYAHAADSEGNIIREIVGEGSVLELGCGGVKTVPHSVGVDFYAKGEEIPTVNQKSVADVVCSVEDLDKGLGEFHTQFDFVVARHILEHLIDPIAAVKHWTRYLKPGGRLLIAVPDDAITESVSLNPEHKHAFTRESICNVLKAAGIRSVQIHNPDNLVSFVAEGLSPVDAGWTRSSTLCGAPA